MGGGRAGVRGTRGGREGGARGLEGGPALTRRADVSPGQGAGDGHLPGPAVGPGPDRPTRRRRPGRLGLDSQAHMPFGAWLTGVVRVGLHLQSERLGPDPEPVTASLASATATAGVGEVRLRVLSAAAVVVAGARCPSAAGRRRRLACACVLVRACVCARA